MLMLEYEYNNSKYSKEIYSVEQFVKECQDVARALRYGNKPLKEVIVKEDEKLEYTFDENLHNKEEIFLNASKKICTNLGIDNLVHSPSCFKWTENAWLSYWGMAYYIVDGFVKKDEDNYTKIEINKILQLKEIDSSVIEFVVYHELLHTELKIGHTKEFKKYEAMFPDFDKCERILYQIAMGQRNIDEESKTYQKWSIYNINKTYTLNEVKNILQENDFILPNANELLELVSDDGEFHSKSIDEKPINFIADDFESIYTQYKYKRAYHEDLRFKLLVKKEK